MDTDHHDAGMLYGDVLHDALLSKFEATVPGGGDYEPPGHPESQGSYDAYARGEIVDRGPDVAFLASDAPRHDPGLSRSVLNLRHKGVRGSVSATPASHEEMFYGFTDRDPRGTNDAPRLDLLRGQNASRQKLLTVRMGDNDDNHQVESQWTGPAISRAKQAMNRRTKATLAIFSDQSVGATAHSHHATNPRSAVIARGAEMTAAGETMAGSGAARFSGGDQRPAFEADRRAGRGVDAAYMTGAGAAPWHRVTGDAELGVQTYGAVRGAGRERVSQAAQGGGRLNTLQTEQAWGASAAGPAPTRKVLAATMGAAARYRGAARSGAADHAVVSAPSVTEGQGFTAGAALTPARDVTRAYRNVIEEQARRPAVPDGAGGVGGAARGLTPAAHPERALRLTDVAVVAPDHLTNVAAIVRGLREGTASSRRRIAGAVIADGARAGGVASDATARVAAGLTPGADLGRLGFAAVADGERAAGFAGARKAAGLTPGADLGRTATLTAMPLSRAPAAEGLVVHSYSTATPGDGPMRVAALAQQGGFDPATWRASRDGAAAGRGQLPGERRSGTNDPTTIGADAAAMFGANTDVGAHASSGLMGSKRLRSGPAARESGLVSAIGDSGSAI